MDGFQRSVPFRERRRRTLLASAFGSAILAVAGPAFAQTELSGAYVSWTYEDYIERGPGEFMGNCTGMPPASDQTTMTTLITRHEDLLTITTIQKDPYYLSEPHVVSRVWQFDSRGDQSQDGVCMTGNELPNLEDTGQVPHCLPGENPEEDYMVRTFNVAKDAAMGHAYTLYPEYRKTIRSTYIPPAECGARAPGYCCGWIERQGLPGGAPNLTCNDGGFGQLGPRGRRASESSSR